MFLPLPPTALQFINIIFTLNVPLPYSTPCASLMSGSLSVTVISFLLHNFLLYLIPTISFKGHTSPAILMYHTIAVNSIVLILFDHFLQANSHLLPWVLQSVVD
jgi:hypothetical protein